MDIQEQPQDSIQNPTPQDPTTLGWKLIRPGGEPEFTALIGPFWARRENASWTYAFRAEPRHANTRGVIHGGMLMSFADQALSLLAWEAAGRQPCATVGLNNQFIAAAKPGDWIVARGRVVRRTRSLVFMQGTLSVNDGEILSADGIWKLLGAE